MDKLRRRKVKYKLCDTPDFDPDLLEEVEENLEKDGWWHTWTETSEFDSKSDRVLIVACGVIETLGGDLIAIPINWFRFVDNE